MEIKYISLKVIIDTIKMSPLYDGLKFDSAIIWANRVINKLEIPEMFIDKVAKVIIENYRGTLPYDYTSIVKCDIIDNIGDTKFRKAMKTSSDPFLKTYNNKNLDWQNKTNVSLDYRIEGDYIYTGLESGTLEVAYRALPVDSDNYIMIPDNAFIISAVEEFIKMKYLEILVENGEDVRNIYENKKQDYAWAIGQAQSQRHMENLDKLESATNALSRLILLRNVHETDYRYSTQKEQRRF